MVCTMNGIICAMAGRGGIGAYGDGALHGIGAFGQSGQGVYENGQF